MAIPVVGVDLSKSVFQLSIAETRHQKHPTQPDALDEADASYLPQPLPPHHRRRVRQVRRVSLEFLPGVGPFLHRV